jgi:hypothetical protein
MRRAPDRPILVPGLVPGLALGLALGLAVALTPEPAAGQLSPGPLAEPHAELEGTAHCLECHKTGRGVEPALCLACHTALRRRLEAGQGLHAQTEYQPCQRCHIDHQGADFALVWWGKAGRDAFDHRRVGYALEGRHAALGCRECHRAELVREPQPLLDQGKDLGRTFLGLDTACLSCHRDVHRGQLEPSGCLDCHTLAGWKPASGFRHDRGRYPLTGKHRQVTCERCHPGVTPADGSPVFTRYRGLAAGSCLDCHRDPHGGRLGSRCESCHTTADWRSRDLARTGFNHDRTRYPLTGLHRRLECRSCHGKSYLRSVADFARCTGCHADPHLGQLRHRADRGACDSCHSVDGFETASFYLEEHEQTDYPLVGAHRAVPCVACHTPLPAVELADKLARMPWDRPPARSPPPGIDPNAPTLQLRFASTRCRDCHDDPHRGDLDRFQTSVGCTACHIVETWRTVTFDHSQSRFPLTGRHRTVECRACHPAAPAADGEEHLELSRRPLTCEGCHEDPHRGQLRRPGEQDSCLRCHSVEVWKPARFDHDRDSEFRLAGAHGRVACEGCHRRELLDGQPTVRYRPLASACRDCHRPGDPRHG